jgi:hypothetical protein
MRRLVFLFSGVLVGVMAGTSMATAQVGIDYRVVARKLIERAALDSGERVLLVAVPGQSDELIPRVRQAIRDAGAKDLGALSARGETPAPWVTAFVRSTRSKSRAELATLFADVDLAIMMPGATATDVPYAAMQDVLRSGKGRTIHFHWSGAYTREGAVLDMDPTMSSLYQRVLLQTDYGALAQAQRSFEEAMRGREVRVTTPDGTDLRFLIGDRPVTKQDGDASAARAATARNLIDREIELPAGAIRVAPIEESVEGRIAFPPSLWANERVEGLIMTFAKGRMTGYRASRNGSSVERELSQLSGGSDAADAARSFREFALGFNPLLAIPAIGEPWIPYYGYGAGVVRLSLGDNAELGGKVGGGYVRWNFFTDATVTVGGEVWVRDGKLVR